NIKPLARWLGIPYAPVAMPFVLPAKVHLNFGDPMMFDDLEIPEEQVTERVEQVKAAISELIDTGLSERKRLF
ncbi:MAG: glycerol acyltransferase, partial [Marinobacter sp.]